jgi:predicted nucleic acid-binding protein
VCARNEQDIQCAIICLEEATKVKIYLDNCCLNRPFDDQTQVRVRLESEAVLFVLSRIEQGDWTWIGSDVLIDEIEQTPDFGKRSRLQIVADYVQDVVEINKPELERAKELQKLGFQGYDALHVACAESAKADVLLTTDDRLLKLAKRFSKKLHVSVVNPLVWLEAIVK